MNCRKRYMGERGGGGGEIGASNSYSNEMHSSLARIRIGKSNWGRGPRTGLAG